MNLGYGTGCNFRGFICCLPVVITGSDRYVSLGARMENTALYEGARTGNISAAAKEKALPAAASLLLVAIELLPVC